MAIRSLSYFLTAAEELNFTSAAQKLYITQQTLSSHIQRLEDRYGVTLFERRPKLCLTSAGERMVHYATRIVQLERMMNAEFMDLSKKGGGVLVVGCSRLRAKYFLPGVWCAYQKLCPNIEIRMLEVSSSAMDEYILSKKADLCISLNIHNQPNINKEPLMEEAVCFIISRSLFQQCFGENAGEKWRQFRNGVTCSDILGVPLILQPSTNYIRQIINQHFERLDIIPRAIFETNDSELILNMCLTGFGAALLPESTLFAATGSRPELRDVYIFPLHGMEFPSVLAYPVDCVLPHYEQMFVDVCKQVFADSMRMINERKQAFFLQSAADDNGEAGFADTET